MYYTIKTEQGIETFESFESALEKIKEYKDKNFVLTAGDKKFSPAELKEKIKAKGIKLAWLADKIGISRSHLSNSLLGRVKMNDDLHGNILKCLEN